METIRFYSEYPGYRLRDVSVHRSWLLRLIADQGRLSQSIQFIFCTDEALYELNRDFLQHETYTDILTFSYHTKKDEPLHGDVYISIDRARENASAFQCSSSIEIRRLLAHGTLHLIGYDDSTKHQKRKMTQLEDRYLSWFETK